MGTKDVSAREFIADNRRFADVINFYLYAGRRVIVPWDLAEQDTAEALTIFGIRDKDVGIQKWRDVLKRVIIKTAKGCIYAIVGVENQTQVHYAMTVKTMLYDAINYGNQVNEAAKLHREQGDFSDGAEFLSGIKAGDKLTPVVTVTLYWGDDAWDAPRSLHEMLNTQDRVILRHVPNYRLNLIAPIEIEDFSLFETSVGEVLEMIKAAKDNEAMNRLLRTNKAYEGLENEAVRVISLFTGITVEVNEKEGKTNMCKAWEEQELKGIEKGRKEGIEKGRIESIARVLQTGTEEDAVRFLEATQEELEKARELMKG